MKKLLFRIQMALVALMMVALMPSANAQITLAGWTFPTQIQTAPPSVYAAECGIATDAAIYLDGTNGSDNWAATTGSYTYNNQGTFSAETAVCEATEATYSLSVVNKSSSLQYVVFKLSTLGYENITIAYDTRGTGSGYRTQTWSHSTDGVNFVEDTVIEGRTATSFSRQTVSFGHALDNQEEVYLRVAVAGATNASGNNRFDNIAIMGTSNVATAEQPAFSIATGNYCREQSVEITCATENATIYYTTDGTTPTVADGILYTAPVAISATTTLKAIAVADGMANSPERSATYTFATEVDNIAAFKAAADGYYRINSALTVVFQSGLNMFVQDESAGILIYGNDANNVAMPDFANGTVIASGACGTRAVYNGITEIKFLDYEGVSEGTPVEPVTVTLANLTNNWDSYDAKLVRVEGVTFAQEGAFNATGIDITQGAATMKVADYFNSIPDATPIPAGLADVIGITINGSTRKIAPRTDADIIDLEPSITIESPADGAVFETGDAVSLDVTTANFNFSNGQKIKFHISAAGFDSTIYCPNEMTLVIESMSFTTLPIGEYTLAASLVNSDNSEFEPAVSDTVHFSIIAPFYGITVDTETLNFTETGESHTFTATASRLTEAIALSVDNADFTVSPATLANTAEAETVTVTFNGTASTNATLTLTSGEYTATVALHAELPIDEVIYSTGFEAEEGFTTANAFNQANEVTCGTDQTWRCYYGGISAAMADRIAGLQYMSIRWYTSSPDNVAYTYTNWDLHNVTKVEFSAKKYSSGDLGVAVSRSTDGGLTYGDETIYGLTGSAQRFTYTVSDSGQYYSVRLKFRIILPDELPTNTSRVAIDSVVVYGVTGLEPLIVATPEISVPSGTYYAPFNAEITCATEGAEIRYTTDGTVPTAQSTLYEAPVAISATTTLVAKAFLAGMDPSTPATATYTFPVDVENIAAFKAANTATNSTLYQITGDVTFVYRNGRYIFIQDETAGLLVYDNNTAVVTGEYNEGDVISGGICGTYTLYHGMVEMIPVRDWAASTSTTTVDIPVVTADEVIANYETYESRLVRIDSVTCPDGATFVSGTASNATFTDGETEIDLRSAFKNIDATVEADSTYDILGFVALYDESYQLYARDMDDLIFHVCEACDTDSVSVADYSSLMLNVYPNPASDFIYVNAENNGGRIEVINAFGQTVYRNDAPVYPMTISMSDKANGVYFVRIITADNRVAVAKVVKE